jgi:3-hydroxyisobutyrate dehydrogenase-like beta-hydroxyacid dehydrogenase
MKVGFIGLGTMGRHMARHLREAGHELVVNDVREEAMEPLEAIGATRAATPAELFAASQVVFTSLPMPADVESVAFGATGLLASAEPGKVWFDVSTNAPSVIAKLHGAFAERGVEFLDAPVSGGAVGAENGRLAFFVGGDHATFEAYRNVLEAMGDQQIYVGSIGQGTVAKLVHNLAGQSMNLAFAEAFTIGVRAGVEPLDLWRAIRQGAGGRARRPLDSIRFLTGDFDEAGFRLALALKDVTLATQLARELNVPAHLSQLTNDSLAEAVERGWGDQDMTALLLLQEERAHVRIAIPRADIDKELENG